MKQINPLFTGVPFFGTRFFTSIQSRKNAERILQVITKQFIYLLLHNLVKFLKIQAVQKWVFFKFWIFCVFQTRVMSRLTRWKKPSKRCQWVLSFELQIIHPVKCRKHKEWTLFFLFFGKLFFCLISWVTFFAACLPRKFTF